jgi:predicted nucleotidyltransferase
MNPKKLAKGLLPPGAKLLYLVRAGSKAYGLDVPTSDDDYRGVFLPGPRGMLGFDLKDHVESKDPDMGLMSLKKFVHLALDGNPNVTEQLFVEPKDRLYMSPKFRPILKRRKLLLSKAVYAPYAGYAKSQMLRAERSRLDNKAMMHCLRLLWQGERILRTQTLPVVVTGPMHDFLMEVRSGTVSHEVAVASFANLMEQLDNAKAASVLPEEPPRLEFEYAVMLIQRGELQNVVFREGPAFKMAREHRRGKTIVEIARRFGTSQTKVRALLLELGLNTHRWGDPRKRKERVIRVVQELRGGKTLAAVGKEFGLTRERVRQIAKMGGVRSLRAERREA